MPSFSSCVHFSIYISPILLSIFSVYAQTIISRTNVPAASIFSSRPAVGHAKKWWHFYLGPHSFPHKVFVL
jgi:hypothetical protein